MPNIVYNRKYVHPESKATISIEAKNQVWYHSPRVNGKLALRSNQASRQNSRKVSHRPFGPVKNAHAVMKNGYASGFVTAELNEAYKALGAETYARFRGRLYKGSAALGVTIGSYKQSRQMIVSRYRQMTLQADKFEKRARRLLVVGKSHNQRRLHAINMRNLGSQYLEMVFGWKPLLSDIHAAAKTVVDLSPQVRWVRASAQTYLDYTAIKEISKHSASTLRYSGVVRRSQGAKVTVSNPNLWLRERAGLNNPAAVAWDLVPWSFVVNMFVNTGALVNSVSDFAGLTFSDPFDVKASVLTQDSYEFRSNGLIAYGGSSAFERDEKFQTPTGLTRPPLVFRVPDANWELAAIAGSLFLQKFRALEVLKLSFK